MARSLIVILLSRSVRARPVTQDPCVVSAHCKLLLPQARTWRTGRGEGRSLVGIGRGRGRLLTAEAQGSRHEALKVWILC